MRDSAKAQVVALMRKMINRTTENKFCGRRMCDQAFPQDVTIPNLIPILPAIANGSEYNQRLGDKVRVLSCLVYGYVAIDFNQTVARTVHVRLLACQDRSIKSYSGIGATPLAQLLKDGTTPAGFPAQGSVNASLSVLAPVNKTQFRVLKDKHFKLSTGTGVNSAESSENPYQYFPFKFTIKCPGLSWDDTTNLPTNYAPWLTAFWTLADGTVVSDPLSLLRVTANSILYYDDA